MSSLESPDESDGAAKEDTVTITAGDRKIGVSLPATASASEAAAITSAIGAHISDQQRAAAAAAASQSEPEHANEWVLEGRLNRFGKRRRPHRVKKGDEWKAAGRSLYR